MAIDENLGWSNWSGAQHAHPEQYFPMNIETLRRCVVQHPKIRVVGAGHSFSPLVKTDALLVGLDQLQGIVSHEPAYHRSTVYAGTRLYSLGKALESVNQALINQGDIDQQSIAGAIATGTHGTGIDLPCLSAFCTGFELMLANGETLQCDAEHHREIFEAGRVALGSFGIMTKIQLQNRASYRLKEHVRLCALKSVLSEIDQWKYQHRHIEFWAFLHADHVILKTLDETEDALAPRPLSYIDEDWVLNLCAEMTRIFPFSNPILQRLLYVVISSTTSVDWSGRVFPTPRKTRFNEMEYQVPVEHGLACFEEVMAVLKKHKVPMFFPIEFRYVKGDDIWLSPFYQRDSVSISVHQFYKQDYASIFHLVEPIFKKYEGRPHWGKLHNLKAKDLKELYPKWDDFMHLRAELDPKAKWLNPYLEELFLER